MGYLNSLPKNEIEEISQLITEKEKYQLLTEVYGQNGNLFNEYLNTEIF